MHLAHWPDAVIVLVLGVVLLVLTHRLDVRVRHLDEAAAWDVDERSGMRGIERLCGIPPVEIGLLLSPQAAVLTAIAALVDRGVLAPRGSGFVRSDSPATPQNALESAVLAQVRTAPEQGVPMARLLADAPIVSALEELRSSVHAKRMVRTMSPTAVGLINLAGLTSLLVVAFALMTWHGRDGGIPLATLSLATIFGVLLLISTVAAFRDDQWVTPGVQSALSFMRFEYRSRILAHDPAGGGSREIGVALFGVPAFTRFWAAQGAGLDLDPEQLAAPLEQHPFPAPKTPWSDSV